MPVVITFLLLLHVLLFHERLLLFHQPCTDSQRRNFTDCIGNIIATLFPLCCTCIYHRNLNIGCEDALIGKIGLNCVIEMWLQFEIFAQIIHLQSSVAAVEEILVRGSRLGELTHCSFILCIVTLSKQTQLLPMVRNNFTLINVQLTRKNHPLGNSAHQNPC